MDKYKPLLFPALGVLILLILSYYLQGVILQNREELTKWLASFGPYVILIYVILQSITTIVAPLGGFFLVVVMIALFGPEVALILAYLVTTPCYIVNFYLSRRYGRPLAERMIGDAVLKKLDYYIKDAGVAILIMTRLLQGGSFDYLSYGWGLTQVSFKTFVLVNIIGGVPSTFVSYFILTRFDNLAFGIGAFYLMTTILAGVSIYLNHYLKKDHR